MLLQARYRSNFSSLLVLIHPTSNSELLFLGISYHSSYQLSRDLPRCLGKPALPWHAILTQHAFTNQTLHNHPSQSDSSSGQKLQTTCRSSAVTTRPLKPPTRIKISFAFLPSQGFGNSRLNVGTIKRLVGLVSGLGEEVGRTSSILILASTALTPWNTSITLFKYRVSTQYLQTIQFSTMPSSRYPLFQPFGWRLGRSCQLLSLWSYSLPPLPKRLDHGS